MNTVATLKLIDAVIGRPLVLCCSRPKTSVSCENAKKVLFIRPGGIGDAALLIPAIAAVKKARPEASIDILCEKRNADVFRLCPEVEAVYRYDKPRELFSTIIKNYDVVIDTEQWHRLSAVVTSFIGASMSIGYATNERKRLFTRTVTYSHDTYEARSFLQLIEPLVGTSEFDIEVPFIQVDKLLLQKVEPLFEPLSGRKIVGLFPGGSVKVKQWDVDRFRRVSAFLARQGFGIIVVGGKEDKETGRQITRDIANNLNLCGTLSLPETAAVLAKASLLITGDSGIMHIGYGLGIRVVSLFGPGREKKWSHRGKRSSVIKSTLSCRPCSRFGYTPRCKRNAECMKLITVEEVVDAAMELLRR